MLEILNMLRSDEEVSATHRVETKAQHSVRYTASEREKEAGQAGKRGGVCYLRRRLPLFTTRTREHPHQHERKKVGLFLERVFNPDIFATGGASEHNRVVACGSHSVASVGTCKIVGILRWGCSAANESTDGQLSPEVSSSRAGPPHSVPQR